MSDAWHIATLRPGKGETVCSRLQADGFHLWWPMHWCWRRHRSSGKRVKVQRPCVPNYLFIALSGRIWDAQRVSGVTGLIMSGSEPAVLPDRALDPMRRRLRQQLGSHGVDQAAHIVELVKGEMVRLLAGPFIGFPATFDGAERNGEIRVNINAFGRETTVRTDIAEVERIG